MARFASRGAASRGRAYSPQEGAGCQGEGRSAAPTGQWLTRQFVAQVAAHLEAALHESNPSDSGERGCSSEGGTAEASNAEAEDLRRYTQAVCRAALQWGLLLLLAVEHLLYKQRGQDADPPAQPKSSFENCRWELEDAVDAQDAVRSVDVITSSTGSAAPADSVIRGEGLVREQLAGYLVLSCPSCVRMRHSAAEALAAFEVIFRASPALATRVLPSIVAWLDAGLLAVVEEHKTIASIGPDVLQVGDEHTHEQEVCHGECWDPAFLVSHLRPEGRLSAVVTSSLGGCPASGPIRRPVEHLQRTRLLGLLLRGSRVLRCSARLLAACIVPATGSDGSITNSAIHWMPGTVPQRTEEQDTSGVASKVETEVQQRLCCQTAEVICSAIHNLKDALIPSAHKAASDCVAHLAPRPDLRFPERIEKTLLTAVLPPGLRWLQGPNMGPFPEATESSLPSVERTPTLLKETDEYFVSVADFSSSASRLALPLAARVHCVTRLSSLALTAKHLPKAFQINPGQADSRILLTVGAAAAVAQLQIAEGGDDRIPRCPLSGEGSIATVVPNQPH
ncbi:hypothetical protein ACSSS7_003543 [Eimeria intestinalis]